MKFRHWFCSFSVSAAMAGATPCFAGIVEDLESPVTTDARWILLSGTGVTLAVLATHESVFVPFEKTTSENKPLGSASKYGDLMGQLVPNALYAGAAFTASYYGSELWHYRGMMMVEASVYAALITTVLKYTIREPRPDSSSQRNSFPSGHATTAFAFAGVVAAEHGWYYGVPAMMLATFVGFSRINDNQHRVQDITAGATVGLTCAYGIYYSHKSEREKVSGLDLQILPIAIPGGTEVAALWKF